MTRKPTYDELETRVTELSRSVDTLQRIAETAKQGEERFRNLFDGSIQGILIHQDHKPLFVNENWARIHGYSAEEILGMETIVGLISREDQERMVEYKKARLKGINAPKDYEYQGVHRDGSLIWLENRVSVVTWDGKAAIQTTIFDITPRKRAEADRENLISKLERALANVKTLSGLLPICAHCKRIRDDKGYWNSIEAYIEQHSEASFSHGMCAECSDKLYGDKAWYAKLKKNEQA